MKQLKPRDKVTQHMTRDGLTLDNQTTGESINISSREAEQDYSAAEPGGTAEKVLERAGDIRERSKAKRAAKDGANTAAQATGPASRLQFTAEERANPALSKYVHKAEKLADKLDAAKEALPKKRVVTKETVYDEAKGKAKTKLHFDKVEKPAPKLKPNPASRPMEEAGLYLHGKIHEVEHENVGVEGGHKGEELAERQAGKAIRSGIRRHKLKPYRAAAKAEKKAIAANAEYIYQKSLRDNPEMAQAVKNPVARFWQKQKIKRDYAKAARAAGQTAQGAASATKTTATAAKKAAEKSKQAASFVARHWKGALLIGGVLTNNLHHQAFRPALGAETLEAAYIHGWVYYLAMAWSVALLLATGVMVYRKCRVCESRRLAWVPFLAFGGGFALCALSFANLYTLSLIHI